MAKDKQADNQTETAVIPTVRIETVNGIGIYVTQDVADALRNPIVAQQISVAARSHWIKTVTNNRGETKTKDTNVLADYAAIVLANGKAHAVLPDGSQAAWDTAIQAAGLDGTAAARRAERYARSIEKGAIVAFLARAMRAYASKA